MFLVQLERKLLSSAWTASESLLTTVLVSKVFWFLKLLVVALALVLVPFCWNAFQWTMGRSQSLVSLSILYPKFQPLVLSLTTVSSPSILFLSTLMSLSCLTTKPFITFASVPLRVMLSSFKKEKQYHRDC